MWIQEMMLAIPSGEIHIFAERELKSIGHPPAISEWRKSKCGALANAELEDLAELAAKQSVQALTRIEQRAMNELNARRLAVDVCSRQLFAEEQRDRWQKR